MNRMLASRKHSVHASFMGKKKLISFLIIGALVLGVGVFLFLREQGAGSSVVPAPLDEFAGCLKEKGAIFYGAFWCPHCQSQKRAFGLSARHLPYVECSTSDGKEQLAVCREKKIEGYPTWEFADGSRLSGDIELKVLAEKTRCVLP